MISNANCGLNQDWRCLMEKKRIELLERESLAFNIMHDMLGSGKWAMDFDKNGKMTTIGDAISDDTGSVFEECRKIIKNLKD